MAGKKGARHGFAAMEEDDLREIARRGGLNARNNPNTHRFTSAEAQAAGRKGGKISRRPKREKA